MTFNAAFILLSLFLLMFLNVPIAMALSLCCMFFVWIIGGLPMSMIMQSFFSSVNSFSLLAVPFFILAGELMMAGGISKRLVNVCSVFMRNITGSLGLITIVTCTLFASISGSGAATVAAIGGIMVPYMLEARYDKAYAASLAAASGSLGPVIPPSISFIMYGIIAQVSITELFIAGIVPGLVMAGCLIVFNYFVCKKFGFGKDLKKEGYVASKTSEAIDAAAAKAEAKSAEPEMSKAKTIVDAIPALLVPVIILGGIYGGVFTPTEAAVVACVYALIVGVFIYRELKIPEIFSAFGKTCYTGGTVILLVCGATAFGRLLTIEQVPTSMAEFVLGISTNPIVVLLFINIFLFIVGMFMETLSAIIILSPLLLAMVEPLGINPVHFGVIMVVNLVIGQCTPPVGVNIFISAKQAQISIGGMMKWLIAVILVLIVALLCITYFTPLSLALPALLAG